MGWLQGEQSTCPAATRVAPKYWSAVRLQPAVASRQRRMQTRAICLPTALLAGSCSLFMSLTVIQTCVNISTQFQLLCFWSTSQLVHAQPLMHHDCHTNLGNYTRCLVLLRPCEHTHAAEMLEEETIIEEMFRSHFVWFTFPPSQQQTQICLRHFVINIR